MAGAENFRMVDIKIKFNIQPISIVKMRSLTFEKQGFFLHISGVYGSYQLNESKFWINVYLD